MKKIFLFIIVAVIILFILSFLPLWKQSGLFGDYRVNFWKYYNCNFGKSRGLCD